jgi:hypothetical protein
MRRYPELAPGGTIAAVEPIGRVLPADLVAELERDPAAVAVRPSPAFGPAPMAAGGSPGEVLP